MHFLARFRRRLGPYGFVAPALVVLCGVLLFPLAFLVLHESLSV